MNKKIKVVLPVLLYTVSIIGVFLLGKFSNNIKDVFSTKDISKEISENKEKKLTVDKVRAIDFDMSYDEIVQILEFELEIKSTFFEDGIESKAYEYREGLDHLTLEFRNGKLININCEVGELNKNKRITEEEYDEIKEGMTYDEVRQLLGYEGRMRSKHNFSINEGEIFTSYSFSNIELTFRNDVLSSKRYEYPDN